MESECVAVAVRCRPMNSKELLEGRQALVDIDKAAKQVEIRPVRPGEVPKSYTFDMVFDEEASQLEIYDECAKNIVESVMHGYNGTIFAYGQTGTGKTHTMEGSCTDSGKGIIPRAFEQIFSTIDWSSEQQFLIRASFLEVYNEDIRDLLSKNPKNKLELHEAKDGSVYVKGLNTFLVKNIQEISSVLEVGKKNRSVGATMMNQDSSRSHSVFTITVEIAVPEKNGEKSGIRVGKLHLVDLAGSERQSKTGAMGDRLREATKINLSLSSLGNVISALIDGKSGHIPYRDSKLTRLLQDSLGGNTKTVMIANVGPADYNYEETLSTLRYANRAKNIKNKPRVNEDPKDAMLREFQTEIARLKAALASDGESGEAVVNSSATTQDMTQLSAEEVEAMRHQIKDELHLEYSNSGVALDEDTLAKVQAEVEIQLAAQIENIQKARQRAAQEAAKLAWTLEQQVEEVNRIQAKRGEVKARNQQLAEKLRLLESKLLQGDQHGSLDQLAVDKEARVQRQKEELRRHKEQESKKAQQIAKLEATAQSVEQRFTSMQEEADIKTQQLQEVWRQYQMARQDVTDFYTEFQEECNELTSSIRELHHELALKNLVIDAFIPQEEVQKVMRRAHYNDMQGSWSLTKQTADTIAHNDNFRKRPMSAAGLRRPTSNFSRIASASGTSNIRFKPENILVLELDMPERTTMDYAELADKHQIQAVLDGSISPQLLQPGSLPVWKLNAHA